MEQKKASSRGRVKKQIVNGSKWELCIMATGAHWSRLKTIKNFLKDAHASG